LSIGEDFACPNCGSTLTAPPRRSLSRKSLKKVATTGFAVSMGLAAMAFGAVKLSTIKWDAPRQIVASRAAPGVQTLGHTSPRIGDSVPVKFAALAAPAQPGVISPTTLTITPSVQSHAAARTGQDEMTPVRPSSSSVVVFNTAGSKSAPLDRPPPLTVARDNGANSVDDEPAPPPTAMVTMVSEAALVVPQAASRPIMLPISFGKPEAPEDDAAPVTLRWRFHGLLHGRHSYFLPAPAGSTVRDALGQICRTPGFLR
jgi:hypothetical protein